MSTTQETVAVPQIKLKKKMPKWLKIVIILLIIAAIPIGGIAVYKKMSTPTGQKKINTFTVKRDNVSVEISGSGAIKPIDQYEVTTLVKGEILSSPFEEGDIVNKGDLLYKIDTADVENSIEKAENSLEKARMSYDEAVEAVQDYTIYSDITGTVMETYVKSGENISNGGKIMDIKDTSTLLLEIPFLAHEAEGIAVGSRATVTLDNTLYPIDGIVENVYAGSSVSSEGVEVKTVEISIKNPGAVQEGDKATAMIGDIACNSGGTFKCNAEKTLVAKASGKVSSMPYKKGDIVYSGSMVLSIDTKEAQKNVTNTKISLSDAELSLQNQREQLEDYSITSPIAGTVIQKNSKAGDSIDTGSNQTVMAIIADMSKMVFEISVDELDITKVQVGQKVDITADAIEDKAFEGVVDYISVVGTTQNGVTSYPVRIEVLNPEGLIPGMNVTANIVVESRENALVVPVSAVQRGNMVMVKKSGENQPDAPSEANKKPEGKMPGGGEKPNAAGQMQGDNKAASKMPMAANVPEGFELVRITAGINDSDYIEIIEGLSEGDIVVVNETANAGAMGQMMPGRMPGMGGGMPGGGMPGGGMR